MPNKSWYSLGEFWGELTAGTLWRAYAKANPNEAALLDYIAGKLVRQEGVTIPLIDSIRTHTGKALLIAIVSLPGGPPSPPRSP